MDSSPDPSSSKDTLPPLAPLQNPRFRHISRSAAKRESVQLLGSIKDLQLHFSRAGLVEHKSGSGVGIKGLGSLEEGDEENHPPSSSSKHAERRERRPWKDVELPRIDPAMAKREAKGLVGSTRSSWGLGMSRSPSTLVTSPTSADFRAAQRDTRDVLVSTAQAIRRVRFLALSIAHTSKGRRVSGTHAPKPKSRLGFSTPSRPSGGLPRAISYSQGERKNSLGPSDIKEDTAGQLRKAALDVLAGLRGIEERLRIDTISHEHLDVNVPTDHRAASPGMSSETSAPETDSTRPTSTTFTEPDTYDSEDEEYSLNALAQDQLEVEHAMTWEERIAAEGRQYKGIEEEVERFEGVRESVRRWVSVVEELFGVKDEAGSGELEEWARDIWEEQPHNRLHAFLVSHLPLDLQFLLPGPDEAQLRSGLLASLADGYLLTRAFNFAISVSPKSWGFIPEEDVHDTLPSHLHPIEGEEAKMEKEWTFRRVGNLTCWAAAVRLRYGLPVHMPTQSASLLSVSTGLPPRTPAKPLVSSAPSSVKEPSPPSEKGRARKEEDRIDFDPLLVAKKGDGWEAVLEALLVKWVEGVAREVREQAGEDVVEAAERY